MTSYCNGFCGIGVPYFQTAPYRLFHNGTEHVGSNMEEVRQIIGVQNRHEKTVGICIIYIYTVTTFKYVEGGPNREAPEVV